MSFDALAKSYHALEWLAFGQDLQRARTTFLGSFPPPRAVLVVGEGDGRFLHELLRVYPQTSVDYIDSSAGMLALARSRLAGNSSRVRFLQADVRNWAAPSAHYNLIVTHFILDCFQDDELPDVVAKLARAAKRDAVWLLADFRLPTRGWRRFRARKLLVLMYAFFRAATAISARRLANPSPCLVASGFRLRRQAQLQAGFITTELWNNSTSQ